MMAAPCSAAVTFWENTPLAVTSSAVGLEQDTVKLTYDRHDMLNLRRTGGFDSLSAATQDAIRSLGLLREPEPAENQSAEAPGTPRGPGRRRKQSTRRRGCRAGLTLKLRTQPFRRPLPSILLANVGSLQNKWDELRLERATKSEVRHCCVMVLTNTGLDRSIPDDVITMGEEHRTFRPFRDRGLGGDVCVFINNNWCTDATVVESYCSPDIEYLTIRCKPFYLPSEFTGVNITAVYIPPDANTTNALSDLYYSLHRQQTAYPKGAVIVAGDFNQADVISLLPHFHQNVDFAACGMDTLGQAYTNIEKAFKAVPRQRLGSSDHPSVMLVPAYKPKPHKPKPTTKKPKVKQVIVWCENPGLVLEDCIEYPYWAIDDLNWAVAYPYWAVESPNWAIEYPKWAISDDDDKGAYWP